MRVWQGCQGWYLQGPRKSRASADLGFFGGLGSGF